MNEVAGHGLVMDEPDDFALQVATNDHTALLAAVEWPMILKPPDPEPEGRC